MYSDSLLQTFWQNSSWTETLLTEASLWTTSNQSGPSNFLVEVQKCTDSQELHKNIFLLIEIVQVWSIKKAVGALQLQQN